MNQSILLIDGLAVAYRAFYAVKGLATPDGRPTNALFGFIRMLRQLEAQWKPDRIVVAFDGGTPPHRLEKCPAYKAQRPPMPDELRSQLPLINEFLEAAGIPAVRLNQQEADDVLATLADRAARNGNVVRIATGDKDLMQLVDEYIRMVPPTKAEEELDATAVLLKTGVAPAQIVDWLALIGDVADNIPGISGVGPKTAAKLLNQFGTLENCLARTDEIGSGTLREKMRAGAETARVNVELMELDRNVPGVPSWEEIPAPLPSLGQLKAFFEKYALRQFSADVPPGVRNSSPLKPVKKSTEEEQLSLF
ncbi:MAG: hypothetical protein LBN38_03075 [Verrucomicrobiota bacterium]|jgi:DNA polymerase-1|nr:hypothetical protein [Verrucomicrobiota bacterium]